MTLDKNKLPQYIEHTILQSNVEIEAIKNLCYEAMNHQFYGVCIPPYFVKYAGQVLDKSPVKVVTVVGFPMGYSTTPAKVEEVKKALHERADEVDVVVNVCAIKNKDWGYIRNDIQSVTAAAHIQGRVIKIILETALLNDEEIKRMCDICNQNMVNFVKTATGFNQVNTSPEVIRLLKGYIDKDIKIKASGGIKTTAQALALIEAGASRIGASRSLQIIGK
ncbi:MAG: deoxyribose-phosphate aldolase [Saprospiraceae bacterium]